MEKTGLACIGKSWLIPTIGAMKGFSEDFTHTSQMTGVQKWCKIWLTRTLKFPGLVYQGHEVVAVFSMDGEYRLNCFQTNTQTQDSHQTTWNLHCNHDLCLCGGKENLLWLITRLDFPLTSTIDRTLKALSLTKTEILQRWLNTALEFCTRILINHGSFPLPGKKLLRSTCSKHNQ